MAETRKTILANSVDDAIMKAHADPKAISAGGILYLKLGMGSFTYHLVPDPATADVANIPALRRLDTAEIVLREQWDPIVKTWVTPGTTKATEPRLRQEKHGSAVPAIQRERTVGAIVEPEPSEQRPP